MDSIHSSLDGDYWELPRMGSRESETSIGERRRNISGMYVSLLGPNIGFACDIDLLQDPVLYS